MQRIQQGSMQRIAFLSLFLLLLCVSCSNDDDRVVPNVLTEICDICIDESGIAVTATLDNGTVLDISSQQLTASVADTVLRSVIDYAIVDGLPKVYNNSPAFCSEALPQDSFNALPQDPLKVISVWQAGKYINMVLGEMTTGKAPHAYAFCIEELRGKTLYVSLLHKQPEGDAESYTRKAYASLPLANTYVTDYDSIALSITTFEGVQTYTFECAYSSSFCK